MQARAERGTRCRVSGGRLDNDSITVDFTPNAEIAAAAIDVEDTDVVPVGGVGASVVSTLGSSRPPLELLREQRQRALNLGVHGLHQVKVDTIARFALRIIVFAVVFAFVFGFGLGGARYRVAVRPETSKHAKTKDNCRAEPSANNS